jgi:hypothetical protein
MVNATIGSQAGQRHSQAGSVSLTRVGIIAVPRFRGNREWIRNTEPDKADFDYPFRIKHLYGLTTINTGGIALGGVEIQIHPWALLPRNYR